MNSQIQTIRYGIALVWFLGCLVFLVLSLMGMMAPGLAIELYWAVVCLLSIATYAAFGWDKWKAKRESGRIPEKTLHVMAVVGGWPGAVWGQRMFRHKTVKQPFRWILNLMIGIHIAVAGFALYGRLSG